MGALRKTFLSNLLLLIGINLLIKPFYLLVIEAQVQERMGPETFGIYFALLNISYILNILPDLGITNWNNRHVAREAIIHGSELKQLLRIRVILGVIYLVVCFGLAFLLRYDEKTTFLLLVLAFNQVLSTGVLFLRSYLSGMHAFGYDRLVSILDRLLLIAILGVALLTISADALFPIEMLVYSQTVAYGVTLAVAATLVWRMKKSEPRSQPIASKSILASSLPFAALILFSMISGRIDGVLLERMSGSFEAGIYAMAFRLGDMLSMIAYLFAVLLLPMFSRLLANHENTAELFSIAFRLLITGCAWVCALCLFQSQQILAMLYTNHVAEAARVLPFTMAAAALFSLQYTTGTLLTAGGKMKHLIALSFVALCINIAMNMAYIPGNGSVGAAQAALLTQGFVFLVQAIMTHKLYKVWTVDLALRSLVFTAAVVSGAYLFVDTNSPTVLSALVITSLTVGFGVLLKMIPVRDIKKLIESKPLESRRDS